MWEIFKLLLKGYPYEEYLPTKAELVKLQRESAVFKTFVELLCQFCVCLAMHSKVQNFAITLKARADYLFVPVEGGLFVCTAMSEENTAIYLREYPPCALM